MESCKSRGLGKEHEKAIEGTKQVAVVLALRLNEVQPDICCSARTSRRQQPRHRGGQQAQKQSIAGSDEGAAVVRPQLVRGQGQASDLRTNTGDSIN